MKNPKEDKFIPLKLVRYRLSVLDIFLTVLLRLFPKVFVAV